MIRLSRIVQVGGLLCVTAPQLAWGDVLLVPEEYTTPQAAVLAAEPGDVIDIAAGNYWGQTGVVNRTLTLRGRDEGVRLGGIRVIGGSCSLERVESTVQCEEGSLRAADCRFVGMNGTSSSFRNQNPPTGGGAAVTALRMRRLNFVRCTVTGGSGGGGGTPQYHLGAAGAPAIQANQVDSLVVEQSQVLGGNGGSSYFGGARRGAPGADILSSYATLRDSVVVQGSAREETPPVTHVIARSGSVVCLENVSPEEAALVDETSAERCPALPFIQSQIAMASDGDVITIPPGLYVENVNFQGKNITLRSQAPESDGTVAATVIRPARMSEATVRFVGTESGQCVLEGFTIENGTVGVLGNGSQAVLRRNVIRGNREAGFEECDGVIADNAISENARGLLSCNAVIRGNLISGNRLVGESTAFSGGPGLTDCDGLIEGNVIRHNVCELALATPWTARVSARGGGLWLCDGVIRNNVVSGNRVRVTVGLHFFSTVAVSSGAGLGECGGVVEHNTVVGNTAESTFSERRSSDQFINAGGGLEECGGVIRNNVVWANLASDEAQVANSATPEHCVIQDWEASGEAIITADPQFVDEVGGDFHLMPTSPARNAGAASEVNEDFEGDARPFGSGPDIGADEYVGISGSHVIAHLLGRITLVGSDLEDANANRDEQVDVSDVVRLESN